MTHTLASRLRMFLLSIRIRIKIMGMVAGLVGVLGIGAILVTRSALTATVGAELDKRGVSIAQDLAVRTADPLLTRDTLQLHQILKNTMANNSDVRYVIVQDGRGRVAAHTFAGGFPKDLLPAVPPSAPGPQIELLDTEEGLIREAASPVDSPTIGMVRVGMSEAGLHQAVLRVEGYLLIAVLAITTLGSIIAWYLTRVVTQPIQNLVITARKASAGDLTGRVRAGARDEVGELVAAFNQMLSSLAESRERLEAYAQARSELLQKVMTAQEDERKRIARELHDETGQAITSLMVGLKVLEQAAGDPAEVRDRSAELRVLCARTLESVRRLSRQLRPSVLDDAGLVPALRRHILDVARHGDLAIDFQVVGDEGRRLAPEVETAAYRIAQEALTNVARHAHAHSASVVLDLRTEVISVVVEDDGVGFHPETAEQSTGVRGMRERATLLGGTLTLESRPGAGATVFAKIHAEGGIIRADSDRR